MARHAALGADLAQPVRVRRIARADDEDQVDLLGEFADRRFAGNDGFYRNISESATVLEVLVERDGKLSTIRVETLATEAL